MPKIKVITAPEGVPNPDEIRYQHLVHIKGAAYRCQYAHRMAEAMEKCVTLRYIYFNMRSKKWMVVVVHKDGTAECFTNKHLKASATPSILSREAIQYVTGRKAINQPGEL